MRLVSIISPNSPPGSKSTFIPKHQTLSVLNFSVAASCPCFRLWKFENFKHFKFERLWSKKHKSTFCVFPKKQKSRHETLKLCCWTALCNITWPDVELKSRTSAVSRSGQKLLKCWKMTRICEWGATLKRAARVLIGDDKRERKHIKETFTQVFSNCK